MCVYSMVIDYYKPKPWDWWTKEKIDTYFDLAQKAKEADTKMGEPDCEDPEKKKLEDKLNALKKKLELLEEIKAVEAKIEAIEKPEVKANLRPSMLSFQEALRESQQERFGLGSALLGKK